MNVVCILFFYISLLIFEWHDWSSISISKKIIYYLINCYEFSKSNPNIYMGWILLKKYITLQMMWTPRKHDSAAILVIFTKMRTTMCKRCRQPLLCTKLFRSLRRSKCTRFAVIQYKPHTAFHPRFSSLHDKT